MSVCATVCAASRRAPPDRRRRVHRADRLGREGCGHPAGGGRDGRARRLGLVRQAECVHWCVGEREARSADAFLADLREAVKGGRARLLKDGSMAGIYGMAAKVPDRTLVADILAGYLDTLYLTRPPPGRATPARRRTGAATREPARGELRAATSYGQDGAPPRDGGSKAPGHAQGQRQTFSRHHRIGGAATVPVCLCGLGAVTVVGASLRGYTPQCRVHTQHGRETHRSRSDTAGCS